MTTQHISQFRGSYPLDQKCLKKKRKKARCWQRFLETREGEKRQDYCRQRNQVRAMPRKIQRNYEKDLAKGIKRNPKIFWKYVNSKTKTISGIPQLIIPGVDAEGNPKVTNCDKEKI